MHDTDWYWFGFDAIHTLFQRGLFGLAPTNSKTPHLHPRVNQVFVLANRVQKIEVMLK